MPILEAVKKCGSKCEYANSVLNFKTGSSAFFRSVSRPHKVSPLLKPPPFFYEGGGNFLSESDMRFNARHLILFAGELALALNMAGAATLEIDRTEIDIGDPITIRFTLEDGVVARQIGLFRADASLSWMEVHRAKRLRNVDTSRGETTFDSETMEVGRHEARLWVVGDSEPAAVTSFELRGPRVPGGTIDTSSEPSLQIDKATMTVGEALVVSFSGARATEDEWIGVFPDGDIRTEALRAWVYTDGTRGGRRAGPQAGRVVVRPLVLHPGKYVAQLFTRDGLAVQARAGFEVIRETASPVPAPTGQLTVAAFNIWGDGNGPPAAPIGPPGGGLSAVVGAILKTRADIVGLQECSASRYDEIVAELRQTSEYEDLHTSIHTRVISRFPIIEEYVMGAASRDQGIYAHGAGAAGVKLRLPSGAEARFFNCHLSATPVGPLNLVRGDRTVEEVIEDDLNSKAGQMQRLLERFVDDPDHDADLTTFIVGDMNSPSHLDWGEDNLAQNAGFAVVWPTSRMLVESGFTDVYRQLYPDPRSHRGFTYTNGYPKNVVISQEMQERIDFIYYRAGAAGVKVRLPSGAEARFFNNGSGLKADPVQFYLHNEDPYPSDHRLLVASFDSPAADLRDVTTGSLIFKHETEGYVDTTNAVVTKEGNWLCVFTTCAGREGWANSHAAACISEDQGKSWSEPIVIEPPAGVKNSCNPVLLATPGGRIYAFYDYNIDGITHLPDGTKMPQIYLIGWYGFRYSDDGGRTWSKDRYRIPIRLTDVDRNNDFGGEQQMFWGIDHPVTHDGSVYIAFTKIKHYHQKEMEGWFLKSDNILTELDPEKIRWQLLPDGEQGLRAAEHGSVQSEFNLVALDSGDLYCMYRTEMGYPCHAYSRDDGHSWSKPVAATYTPGGRRMKHNRACPRLWKTNNESGRYLFWFNNHATRDFWPRNPIWITGGIEQDGFIHWSQPEILLYWPVIERGMSYPDLIQEGGGYWVTETQKTIARIHKIDPTLLEGLWNQGQTNTVAQNGLVLSLDVDEQPVPNTKMPTLPSLASGGGHSIEFWMKLDQTLAGQVVLDSRDEKGKGIVIITGEDGTIRIDLNDGTNTGGWDCDAGLIQSDSWHHVVIIVDGGPNIITFVVDGVLCDGGSSRDFGWSRFSKEMDDVNGSRELKIAPSLKGRLKSVRLYDRYLRTSEAIGNFQAGMRQIGVR